MARRSAKQKAATRKLVAFNKRKAKRKAPKRRAAPKRRKAAKVGRKQVRRKAAKVNKRKKASKSMVKGIPIINNPTFKKIAVGVGAASLVGVAVAQVAPSLGNNAILKPAVAFLAGGPIAAIVTLFLNGGLGSLNLGGNGAQGQTVNTGFA